MAGWMSIAVLSAMVQVACSMEGYYDQSSEMMTDSMDDDSDLDSGKRASYYCGYEITKHQVTSRNGYITTLFRLPYNQIGQALGRPIILQHSFGYNGDDWFRLGKNSLPCLLAEYGYDVWVANARGTRYSRMHTRLSTESLQYWDFSFHEMAVEDLPPTIDHILKVSNKPQLTYVGHGMGGSIEFVLQTKLQDYAKKIDLGVTFSATCQPFTAEFTWPSFNLEMWAYKTLILTSENLKWVTWKYFRSSSKSPQRVNDDQMFFYEGMRTIDHLHKRAYGKPAFGKTDRMSVRTILHLCQLIIANEFLEYEYDFWTNIRLYQTPTPPKYDLQKVQSRQILVSASKDAFISGRAARYFCMALPRRVRELCFYVKPRDFGHEDYVRSKYAKQSVYDIVLRQMLPPPLQGECLVSR